MEASSEKRTNALIVGKILDTLTEKEETEFQEWLAADLKNRNLYERLKQENYQKERNEYIQHLQVDQRWTEFKASHLIPKHKTKTTRFLAWGGIAASVFIILGIGWLWISPTQQSTLPDTARIITPIPGSSKAMLLTADGRQYILQDTSLKIAISSSSQLVSDGKKLSYTETKSTETPESQAMSTIVVPRGGEYEVVLSDQTKIYLNAGSRLRFPAQFRKGKREVELEGEAYFKVSKDSLRPFVVRVINRLDVEVLGTEFNITAYPEEPTIATTLNSGLVRISDGIQQVKLKPDQQALFVKNSGEIECREVEAWIYSAWTEGRIVLRNVTLQELMERLSRWYDLQIIWHDEQIKHYHFSGEMLRYENFSEILSMLEKATSVHFNILGNQINIYRK